MRSEIQSQSSSVHSTTVASSGQITNNMQLENKPDRKNSNGGNTMEKHETKFL